LAELETLKKLANEAADRVLSERIDDDDFEERVTEVEEKYEDVLKLDANDLEANFNVVFFKAFGLKLVPEKHTDAMEILSGASKSTLSTLNASTMPAEQKQAFLAEFSVRMEKIMDAFCWETRSRTDMAMLLGSIAFKNNPYASGWGVSEFDLFKESLDNVSEEVIQRSLNFASEILVALNKLDLDNKYACIAHIAKDAVYEAVKAPAFAYDDAFFEKYEGLLRQTISVVKTSAPHDIYYVPTPYYIGQQSDELESRLKHSKLKKMIDALNEEAKAEAIQRYWETHPGEKEALTAEKEKLDAELNGYVEIKSKNKPLIEKAEAERDNKINPAKENLEKAEAEIRSLEKELSELGLFQGKKKKALRAVIEEKQAALLETKKQFDELQKQAVAAFEAETAEPNRQLEAVRPKIKELSTQIKEIGKKLENPLIKE
jgi:hypothetical protein